MEKLDSASEEDNSEGKDRSRSGSSDHGKLSVSLVDQISHRMTDWFNVAREKLLGDDYWIPNDPTEVANFPSALLPAHNHILPNKTQKVRDSFFMVVEGRYKNRPDEDWFHVTFTWNESERNDDKRPESPERKPKTLSMFRSTDLQETTDLYESCLHCQDLFLILDKRKDLKRDINALMAKMRSHPLWLAVHIAAGMGTSVYFSKKAEESDSKLKSVLHTASHPEGIYPLQIAIERNHIELVKVLLELGASLSKTDVSGNNALHYGARASSQMLELLGEHTEAPDLLNSLNREGCTPLFVAIRCSNPLCMVTLMRMGAELNITCKGRSPLHETMQQTSGNVKEVIKTLVEVSPGSLTDVDKLTGNTALHVAASKVPLGGLLMAAGSQLDLNVRNHAGQSALHVHTHRTDLGSVLTLAAYGADLNAQDVDGNTPLHIAVSKALKEIVQALLVLGADPNLCNNSNDTPRHLAAKLHNKQRNEFVRCLTMCGAKRCLPGKVGCGSGCADLETRKLLHSSSTAGIATQSSYKDDTSTAETDTEPPEQVVLEFKHKMCLERIRKLLSNHKDGSRPKLIGLLSLDGGGIRGLVIIQILIALEAALGDCLWDYFDWTAGTSTGSFVAAGLAKKKSLRECQRIYLRFKDQIFEGWSRPYNTVQLEEFIKNEMGDDTTMADIAYPRVVVTTVLADKHPVRLQLFRNYSLPLDEKQNEMMGFLKPEEQFLWRVLRCSSAAPTYFASVEGKYVDGGVIANNPALDLLSEVQNWNSTLEYLDADSSDKVSLGFVLSVGTGRIPDIPIDNLDFEMTGNPYKVAIAMQNLGFMLIDQVTATEGSPVDRARAWCQSWGVPYFRFSTPMTKDYKLDTRADSEIVSLMWDTQEYINTQHEEIAQFCQLIKMVGPNFNRRDCFDVHKGDVDFSLVD